MGGDDLQGAAATQGHCSTSIANTRLRKPPPCDVTARSVRCRRATAPIRVTCGTPSWPIHRDPVIGRTWEIGARGQLALGEDLRWRVAFYRTTLDDDLTFAVTGTSGAGFFTNIDETRRQGVELGLNGQWESVHWSVNYGFVDATYKIR
jgi:iron complex outermembrane receptor protein